MSDLRGRPFVGILFLAGCSLAATSRDSEPISRWFVGGNVSFRSTTDEIRSNAAISIGPLGNDGIPYTFDTGEVNDCNDPAAYCDPRPDDLLNNPTVIQDAYQLDLHAGYSPVNWLSIQLDAGYFKSNVGPVDAYLADHYPFATDRFDPMTLNAFRDREVRYPLGGGQITEIPIALSMVIQFKTLGSAKPYLGVGVGKIYTDLNGVSDIPAFNERVSKMRVRSIADKFGKDITPRSYYDPYNQAHVPVPHAVTVEVSDSSEWHLTGGVEWMLGSRIGVVFDARYTFTPGGIRFNVSGHDQIDLLIWSEKLFRPDGTLHIYSPGAVPPNPRCFDQEYNGLGCDHLHMEPADALVDPEGIYWKTGAPQFVCPAIGDFDKDGVIDLCYGKNAFPSNKGFTEPRGDLIIQGGEISLTAFAVSIGLRYHF